METHNKLCLTNHNGPCNCVDLETVCVCADCHAKVKEVSHGDEGLTVCPGCKNVEQATEEWSEEKFDREGYHV